MKVSETHPIRCQSLVKDHFLRVPGSQQKTIDTQSQGQDNTEVKGMGRKSVCLPWRILDPTPTSSNPEALNLFKTPFTHLQKEARTCSSLQVVERSYVTPLERAWLYVFMVLT